MKRIRKTVMPESASWNNSSLWSRARSWAWSDSWSKSFAWNWAWSWAIEGSRINR
jgi:hypothetical protein